MADLKLDFAELRSSARNAETVASTFARAESIAGAAAADTGHDRLGSKVREFGDKWDIARGKLEENLQVIADYLRAVVDTFSDLDTDLAGAVESAQNTPGPTPAPAAGGPASAGPTPAPTPGPAPAPGPAPSPSPGPAPTPAPGTEAAASAEISGFGPAPSGGAHADLIGFGPGPSGDAHADLIGFGPGPSGDAAFEPVPHDTHHAEGRPVVEPTPVEPVLQTLPAILDESEVPAWARDLIADDTTHGATR